MEIENMNTIKDIAAILLNWHLAAMFCDWELRDILFMT